VREITILLIDDNIEHCNKYAEYAKARNSGADFIFTKDKPDYSPETVIELAEIFRYARKSAL